MNARSLSFFLFVFFIFTRTASAQQPELINNTSFRADAQIAVDSLYNFNFNGACRILKPWKNKHPAHPLWMLFDGMELWWQVLSDLYDTSNDEKFFNIMKRTDYEASKLLRKNRSHADALIIKAISNGYVARQYANRDEWIASINNARKALSAYNYLIEIQPGLPDLYLAEGLKLYYSAHLPEAYPIVKTVSWFLPEGSKEEGLKYMRKAAENAIFARAEATYFLGNINYNYENNYDVSVRNFKELVEQYPRNNYYTRIYVKNLYKMSRYQEALDVIDRSLEYWSKNQIPYETVLREELFVWKGRILSKYKKDGEAVVAFKKAFQAGESLPESKNRPYHVVAGYHLGKLLYEKEKYKEARFYLNKIASYNVEPDYRSRARQILEDMPYIINK